MRYGYRYSLNKVLRSDYLDGFDETRWVKGLKIKVGSIPSPWPMGLDAIMVYVAYGDSPLNEDLPFGLGVGTRNAYNLNRQATAIAENDGTQQDLVLGARSLGVHDNYMMFYPEGQIRRLIACLRHHWGEEVPVDPLFERRLRLIYATPGQRAEARRGNMADALSRMGLTAEQAAYQLELPRMFLSDMLSGKVEPTDGAVLHVGQMEGALEDDAESLRRILLKHPEGMVHVRRDPQSIAEADVYGAPERMRIVVEYSPGGRSERVTSTWSRDITDALLKKTASLMGCDISERLVMA